MGDGALHSMHFWFAGEVFWIVKSWALASSTGMSAAISTEHKMGGISREGKEEIGA